MSPKDGGGRPEVRGIFNSVQQTIIIARFLTPKIPHAASSPVFDSDDVRNHPFKHATRWLEWKRDADALPDPGLWRVHDALYDLSDFARRHPGGRQWIEATRGTDITEPFEASHFFEEGQREALLTKYHVRDCPGLPRTTKFTFEEDGFYRTLKRRAAKVLKEAGGSGATTQMLLIQGAFGNAFLTG